MNRYALFYLCLSMICVGAAACRGDSASNDASESGPRRGNSGEPLTINDPLFIEATDTVAEWITPEWYTCETEESACGLPCPEDDLWVAINPTDFRNSAVCSACMAVEGPLGEVVVEVIENCAGACADGEIELSRTAFETIADLDEGRADVSWKLVPCEREGPIAFAFETDSDEWWAGIQVRNPALPVSGLAIRIGGGEWTALEMDGWNHFPVSADLGGGPFDFRVTAIDGQELLEEDVAYRPGEVVQGSAQFEI